MGSVTAADRSIMRSHVLIPLLSTFLSVWLPSSLAVQTVSLASHWDGGFQGEACIPIVKELDGWKAHITFDQDVQSLEIWVADAQQVSPREFILTNKDYNSQEHV